MAMNLFNNSASFTRPNDTTAYSIGDLVANSITAGSNSGALMNWIDKLEKHGKAVSVEHKRRKPKPKVESVIVTVRPPNERTGDPGEAAIGSYTVQDGVLSLTDENGKPVGEKLTALVTEANAHAVAAQLTTKRWAESRNDDFNRPVVYGPLGLSRRHGIGGLFLAPGRKRDARKNLQIGVLYVLRKAPQLGKIVHLVAKARKLRQATMNWMRLSILAAACLQPRSRLGDGSSFLPVINAHFSKFLWSFKQPPFSIGRFLHWSLGHQTINRFCC
jgi:hypothetical protein